MSLLMDKTLKEFNELLASSEPAPGGGSSSALSGLLASSLTLMVINLSVGKKSYLALEDRIKETIEADKVEISSIYKELTTLVDEDTKAFNQFMAATRLPKDTEDEKELRMASIEKASFFALEVPLLVSERCLKLLKHQITIARYGNKNAVSDIGVGALLAYTGLEGAILNVRINLPGISDEHKKSEAAKKIAEYSSEGLLLKTKILNIVDERIGF